MDYVKDGTLIIQARTIEEVNSIDRVVVYADGCQRECLMPLPTVEERKEGRWIAIDKDDINYDYYECSNCRSEISVDHKKVCDIGFVIEDFKYCPNCGARMRGE